jgi:hypothetical protein
MLLETNTKEHEPLRDKVKLTQSVKFLTCIREGSGSNLSRDTDYVVFSFPQSL